MHLQHRAVITLAALTSLELCGCGPEAEPPPADAAVDSPPVVTFALRFARAPAGYVSAADHSLPSFSVAVVDTLGMPHPEATGSVTVTADGGSLAGPMSANFERGVATFTGLSAVDAGSLTLHFRYAQTAPLDARVLFAASETYVPVTPREARQGTAYDEALPEVSATGALRYLVARGELPMGLSLDAATGHISGTPRGPEAGTRIDVVGYDDAFAAFRFGVHLAVFDGDDTNNDNAEDLTADGTYLAGHISTRIAMADVDPDVSVLITYPTTSLEGPPAEGRFPVVVFHQAVPIVGTAHPIYDRYEALFNHWATRGYISISVDATRVFFRTSASSSIVNLSFSNLLRVHRYIRSEIDYLHQIDADREHPLFEHIDFEHMVVSGHSRGGGGTVVALAQSPDVMGFMALQPVNPLGSPGGAVMFNRPLPPRPMLIVSAGRDGDVIYPIVDTIYEQTTGPTAMLTIRGGKHSFTKRVDPVDPGGTPTITAAQQVGITQVYTTAFLDRYVRMDLSRESVLYGRRGLSTDITDAPINGVLMRGRRYIVSQPVIDFSPDSPMTTVQGGAVTSMGTSVFTVGNAFESVLRRSMLTGTDWNAVSRFARALTATPSSTGAEVRLPLGAGLDVHDKVALVFSIERESSLLRDVNLRVTDAAGHVARTLVVDHMGAVGIGDRFSNAIVPLAALTAATASLDLAHLTEIAVEFSGASGSGLLWLDDVRFE